MAMLTALGPLHHEPVLRFSPLPNPCSSMAVAPAVSLAPARPGVAVLRIPGRHPDSRIFDRPAAQMTRLSNPGGAMGRLPSVVSKRPPGHSSGVQRFAVLRFLGQRSPLLLAVPLVLAAVAYARVLGGGFVFDDRTTALSPAVRDLGARARSLFPGLLRGGRPVVES